MHISFQTVIVSKDYLDIKLRKWFFDQYPSIPYSLLAKWERKKCIYINNQKVTLKDGVKAGDEVTFPTVLLSHIQEKPLHHLYEKHDLSSMILYEDDKFLVLNKPSGWAVQGGSKTTYHIDGLLRAHYATQSTPPRLVHRLDKETSGVLITAQTLSIAQKLMYAFQTHSIKKVYLAVVYGSLKSSQGIIQAPLRKKTGGRFEHVIVDEISGQRAVTAYTILDSSGKFHLIQLMPETGRTHQLRVHLKHLGAPIIGDKKYGPIDPLVIAGNKVNTLLLHAYSLQFQLNPKEKIYNFRAACPPMFLDTIHNLGLKLSF